MSHSDAVIAELLVSSTEELILPQRMKRQLEESSSQELLQVLNRRDEELVRHLCLDTHCDRQWESLPNDVRVMFLRRVACEPFEVNDSEVEWIESNRCDQKQIHHQTYLARRDLHACVSLLIDEYAAALLRDPVQKTISVRREIINDIAAEAAREVAPLEIRSGWRILLKPFTRIRRFSSIFVKFLFLGFIAEPEYQRELVYVLRGNFFKRPITFLATALWSYARFLQNILLPFFFVRPFQFL
jgi:hypothetical protein